MKKKHKRHFSRKEVNYFRERLRDEIRKIEGNKADEYTFSDAEMEDVMRYQTPESYAAILMM